MLTRLSCEKGNEVMNKIVIILHEFYEVHLYNEMILYKDFAVCYLPLESIMPKVTTYCMRVVTLIQV